jgi:hypothetical protein
MYVNVFHIHAGDVHVPIVEKLDEYGKGAWIALIVLGFALFWPLGLAALFFVVFSGRARAWKMEQRGRWHNARSRGFCWNGGGGHGNSSGNAAFDEYREQTLRRLEEEQKEFFEYLERLRKAKDKEEFDRFMADRKGRTDLSPA